LSFVAGVGEQTAGEKADRTMQVVVKILQIISCKRLRLVVGCIWWKPNFLGFGIVCKSRLSPSMSSANHSSNLFLDQHHVVQTEVP
jgi:hypothetical protein